MNWLNNFKTNKTVFGTKERTIAQLLCWKTPMLFFKYSTIAQDSCFHIILPYVDYQNDNVTY